MGLHAKSKNRANKKSPSTTYQTGGVQLGKNHSGHRSEAAAATLLFKVPPKT